MAIDGPGIIDSDVANDTYNGIMDLYDSGVDVDVIYSQLDEEEVQLTDEIYLEI